MKSFLSIVSNLVVFLIIISNASCERNLFIEENERSSYPVVFKFPDFKSQISNWQEGKVKSVSSDISSYNSAEEYLYYWSFNNDNLDPDIRYIHYIEPSITYNNGLIPSSFVNSTYSFSTFAPGRALSFSGAKEIIVKIPIDDVPQIKGFGFDVGSSNTGPKDFDLYISTDKGNVYDAIVHNNQFENTNTANFKHSYFYDLLSHSIKGEELWIKILPKAGERGTSGSFNESSGSLRLDNLYLIGLFSYVEPVVSINKLHYFLFNQSDGKLVMKGERDLKDLTSLDLSIPEGKYQICFLANTSNQDLIIPSALTLQTFYVGNVFSNHRADVYGYVGELEVSKEQTKEVVLDRLYSQVKIEFSDLQSLSQITKIVVRQQHTPFFYSPFNINLINPISDVSSVEFTKDMFANRQLLFQQFMGKLSENQTVSYSVSIFAGDELIRELSISSAIKNNMQLVFRGNILVNTSQKNGFQIIKNENWDGEITTSF